MMIQAKELKQGRTVIRPNNHQLENMQLGSPLDEPIMPPINSEKIVCVLLSVSDASKPSFVN